MGYLHIWFVIRRSLTVLDADKRSMEALRYEAEQKFSRKSSPIDVNAVMLSITGTVCD